MNVKFHSAKLFIGEPAETMISFRDMETKEVHQFNGSKRAIGKLNKWIEANWSEALTADEVVEFGWTVRGLRYQSRPY